MFARRGTLFFVFSFCIAGGSSVTAATLSQTSGEVLVNTGSGYVSASASRELAPGTQILVRPGGEAYVTYSADCVERITAGRIAVVQESAPCTAATTQPAQSAPPVQAKAAPPAGTDNTQLLIGAGLLAGGGIAAVVALSGGGGGDKPASP